MRLGICKKKDGGCGKIKLLTKHSEIGGHKEGEGWIYLCRECHDIIDNCVSKRKNKRYQKGSSGKRVKGTSKRKK